MSEKTIKILNGVARALGVTETEVIQTCVAKYALEIGHDVDRAKELLLQQICELAAKSPISHPRSEESIAMNEERGRGREAAETATTASPSAAGALASMAGEGWSEGKKGKKKS